MRLETWKNYFLFSKQNLILFLEQRMYMHCNIDTTMKKRYVVMLWESCYHLYDEFKWC